ncbi:hypothetical protein F5Y19DRAFT_407709 [Xylariaceae sp. FL1651]|nr:hypothetical protein F5Y19DRAFT_407709 [Xylariaceae sp. FL1651]
MSQQPGFGPSFAEGSQLKPAMKIENDSSEGTQLSIANLRGKLQAAEAETRALRNGMEKLVLDLLAARKEGKTAHEAREDSVRRCTELSQEVASLREALESERRSQTELRQAQTRDPTFEQQKEQLELRCTGLRQEVAGLHAALQSERQRQDELHQAQAKAIVSEQQSQQQQQQIAENEIAAKETQLNNYRQENQSQAADIEKLRELVRFYKGNSERLSAEISQLRGRSKQ